MVNATDKRRFGRAQSDRPKPACFERAVARELPRQPGERQWPSLAQHRPFNANGDIPTNQGQ